MHKSRNCLLGPPTPENQVSLSFRHRKHFPKDASFLETNKIIGLQMLKAVFPLAVSSFIATEKSLFGGAHYPSRSCAAHLHMKEEVHKRFIIKTSQFLKEIKFGKDITQSKTLL